MKYLIPVIPLVAAIGVAAAQAPLPLPPAPGILLGANPAPGLPDVPDSALPTFEVASVKANKNGPITSMMARMLPGRLEATNMPARFLLQQAYRLPAYQMQGVPAWLDSERFDIRAKAPEGTPQDQLSLMIRALLIERFKLVTHRETKEAPIYELVMARSDGRLGSKLSKTTDDCEAIMAERRANARARGP